MSGSCLMSISFARIRPSRLIRKCAGAAFSALPPSAVGQHRHDLLFLVRVLRLLQNTFERHPRPGLDPKPSGLHRRITRGQRPGLVNRRHAIDHDAAIVGAVAERTGGDELALRVEVIHVGEMALLDRLNFSGRVTGGPGAHQKAKDEPVKGLRLRGRTEPAARPHPRLHVEHHVTGLDERIVRELRLRRGRIGHIENRKAANVALVEKRPIEHVHALRIELRESGQMSIRQHFGFVCRDVLVWTGPEQHHLIRHHFLRGRLRRQRQDEHGNTQE